MIGKRYRLLKPASAVYRGNANIKPSCVHLPIGSIIHVTDGYDDDQHLVGVVHENRQLLMFIEDIRNPGMAVHDAAEC
jgi:hypothetical protein